MCHYSVPLADLVLYDQESGSDVHQHKQALKDLEAKLVVRGRVVFQTRAGMGTFTLLPNVRRTMSLKRSSYHKRICNDFIVSHDPTVFQSMMIICSAVLEIYAG